MHTGAIVLSRCLCKIHLLADTSFLSEMRRLFEHIRKLVENRYKMKDGQDTQNRELPLQSVSAFCFLRFIVPAILHPHLFGLMPGNPLFLSKPRAHTTQDFLVL